MNPSEDLKSFSDLIRLFKSQNVSQIRKDPDAIKEKSESNEKFAAFKHYAKFREDPTLTSLLGNRRR